MLLVAFPVWSRLDDRVVSARINMTDQAVRIEALFKWLGITK